MAKINAGATNRALFKNTGIIAIGQISTRVVNFFLLPLYTALLSQSEYGLVDLLTTYSGLIAILIGLQMNQAIFIFLVTKRDDAESIKKTVSTVFTTTIVIFAVYIILFSIVQNFLQLECKWFLLAHVICAILLQMMSGVARGIGNNTDYAIGNFLSSATILILNVIMIAVLHLGVAAMLTAYVIGPIIGASFIFVHCKIGKYISFRYADINELKTILKYSVPLVPNELSWSVIHSSDRWVVSYVLGIAANGLIAVASKFSLIYTTAFSIFNTSWTEQVVLHYKDDGGPEYISDMFNRMITFFASLAIGIVAVMPFVFGVMVNKQFSDAYGLIPIYMIAVFFNAVIGMLSAIYLIENETKHIAISTGIAAVINLLVDIVLIRSVGVFAAPISSVCGYASISIWRFIDINKRHCKIAVSKKNIVGIIVMLAIAVSAFYSNSLWIRIVALVLVGIIAGALNKSFLATLFEIVKQKTKHI